MTAPMLKLRGRREGIRGNVGKVVHSSNFMRMHISFVRQCNDIDCAVFLDGYHGTLKVEASSSRFFFGFVANEIPIIKFANSPFSYASFMLNCTGARINVSRSD